ncbi:hypothetical protein EHQ94_00005 [Leptospira meyeri]|nr:hypothetical protein EHQ93_11495 [Leptospira meyeri]TGM74363.1 hypothetical protein EHQ94_00005 [Leptospira meyeri]
MKVTAQISNTRTDSHGQRMTKASLDKLADQINNTEKPNFAGVEHDSSIPPVGRWLNAFVIKADDNEYELYATQEIYEKTSYVLLEDGTKLIKLSSELNDKEFEPSLSSAPEKPFISFDMINFGGKLESDNIVAEIKKEFKNEIEFKYLIRKSDTPPPEIVFILTNLMSNYLFDKVRDKAFDNFFENIENIILNYFYFIKFSLRLLIEKKPENQENQKVVFKSKGDPEITLIFKTSDPDLITRNLSKESLNQISDRVNSLKNIKARSIQFTFDETTGKWILNYLIDSSGNILGNEELMTEHTKIREILINSLKPSK